MHKIAVVVLVCTRFASGRRAEISQESLQSAVQSGSHAELEDDDAVSSGETQTPPGNNDLSGLSKLLLALQGLHPGSMTRSEYGINSAAVVQPKSEDQLGSMPWHRASSTNEESAVPVSNSVPLVSPKVESFGDNTQTQTQRLHEVGSLDKSGLQQDSKPHVRLVRGMYAARGLGRHGGFYRLVACAIVLLVSLILSFKDIFLASRSRNVSKGSLDESLFAKQVAFRHKGVVSSPASNSIPSRTAAVQMSLQENQGETQASEVDVRSSEIQMKDEGIQKEPQGFQLYPQRWVQLAYLSLFAFLSDWVCFGFAAEPGTFQSAYGRDPATLIDLFLFTNVFFCFLEPTIVGRFGLRRVITFAGAMMAVGCLLRSGLPFTGMLPTYELVVAGTLLVGAAQPFFQCTPPLLSATWFGANERALATATAINFNQIGIMTAFLVGGTMMEESSGSGLSSYLSVMSVVSLVLAAGAFFQFQERPITPPTGSAAARIAVAEGPNPPPPLNVATTISTMRELLATPGFIQPLVAFVGSICVSNLVSAFVQDELIGAGVSSQTTVDYAGAGFQVAIVLGGIILGGYVDRTKAYKQVTLACLLGGSLLLLPLGISGTPVPVVLIALLGLGALIGPVQPINAELAVEVAYPADENAIEALQQLCGNLGSALLVPVAEFLGTQNLRAGDSLPSERGDTLLLTFIAVGALLYFSTFDAQLKRNAFDCVEAGEAGDGAMDGCDIVLDDGPSDLTNAGSDDS